MKSYRLHSKLDTLQEELNKWGEGAVDLVIVFTSRDLIENSDMLKTIESALPNSQIIGCSTSGEIGESVEDDSISLLGMSFDSATFKCSAVKIDSMQNSRAAGEKMAQELAGDDLKGIFTLLPGVNVNGSQFTLGLKGALPMDVAISGGLAGDGLKFQSTKTIHNSNDKI